MENISTITYLKFSIGGYFGSNSEVVLNKKTVTYRTDESSYNIGVKHKKKISSDDLELFVAKLNEIKLSEWDDEYVSDTLDGEQWELRLTFNDKKKKGIHGSNCYPSQGSKSYERTGEFDEFLKALSQLIKEPTFF
jgi:hypothetical protein